MKQISRMVIAVQAFLASLAMIAYKTLTDHMQANGLILTAFPSAISDIIATTIQNRSGVIADNVTKNNALLAYLGKSGNIKKFSGGNVILQELSFAENGNASWYSGYETLPIAASDVISAAQYDIKQAAVPITISGLEQLQNAGKERIIDLLEARVSVGESTMSNLIAAGIYSDGTGYGGKEIDGLKKQVIAVPTNVVGGIDRNTAVGAFWKNQALDLSTAGLAAASASNIQGYLNRLWGNLVRGSDRPNLIVMDNVYWGFYMASLQAIQRFTNVTDANLGFVTLKFMDADVVLDGGVGGFAPASTAYMLNTKYLHYRPHADRNMVPLSPGKRYSVNQDAEVQILAWAGNLTASNLSLQGILQE